MMEQSRHPIDVIARQTGLPIATACVAPSCVPWTTATGDPTKRACEVAA